MAPTNRDAAGVWTAQLKNNAQFGRQLMQALFENNDGTPMNGTRSGVVPTTGLTLMSDLLVYNVVGLNMDVAPGWGVAHRSGQGPYLGALAAVVTVTADTAPASNPRNDLVIMRMYDAALGDTPPGGQPCRIEVITGTPAASPVDPMTVNALGVYTGFTDGNGGVGIPLARARVSTAGVITLTYLRRAANLAGAVRLLLEGDSDTSGRVGQFRYNPTTDVLELRASGGTWNRVLAGDATPRGVVAFGTSSTGSPAGITTADTMQAEVATGSVVNGRRYRISHIRGEAGSSNILHNVFRVQAGGSITVGGSTTIVDHTSDPPGSFRTTSRFDIWVATFTGTATFGISSFVNTGTASVQTTVTRKLLVEDIGL